MVVSILKSVYEKAKTMGECFFQGFYSMSEGVVNINAVTSKSDNGVIASTVDFTPFKVDLESCKVFSLDYEYDLEIVSDFTEPDKNLRGILDRTWLAEKSVLVLGCGSVATYVLEQLARSGVGVLTVVDFDKYCARNLLRCATIDDLNRYKVLAQKNRVQKINPNVSYTPLVANVNEIPEEELIELITGHDIVVSVVDDLEASFRINKLCLIHDQTCVFIALFDRAMGGEIFFISPKTKCCYECYCSTILGAHKETMVAKKVVDLADKNMLPDYQEANIESMKDLMNLVAVPGLACDIAYVTLAGVKVILALLLEGTDYGVEFDHVAQQGHFIGNRKEWHFRHPMHNLFFDIDIDPVTANCTAHRQKNGGVDFASISKEIEELPTEDF